MLTIRFIMGLTNPFLVRESAVPRRCGRSRKVSDVQRFTGDFLFAIWIVPFFGFGRYHTPIMSEPYDALLVVAYGGPEKMDDVIPFLENALRGRNIPRARLEEVGEHYKLFNGKSPLNDQCRALIAAIETELKQHGPNLPVYWGNRNWQPMLTDTLRRMQDDGVNRALALFTSPYSSYSSCRQYRENIAEARERIGDGVPVVDKLRCYYNHPGFIDAMVDRTRDAMAKLPGDAAVIFTAHSIPHSMADGCDYVQQLRETCSLVAKGIGRDDWTLVYQSRSGPPKQPWLEPDICDYLTETKPAAAVLIPIGFISDHMEVIYDLDTEAKQVCDELGINMQRAATVGTHPKFIAMIRDLILERTADADKLSLGNHGPCHDVCPEDCCPAPRPHAHAAR
jgi:ferrochelatase